MIPEPLARLLANVPAELVGDLFNLLQKVLTSPDPKDALARAAQVLAHEKASDAAVDAMFEAKKHIPGSGV
jgi:hypothetical protein